MSANDSSKGMQISLHIRPTMKELKPVPFYQQTLHTMQSYMPGIQQKSKI
jgi:hypothetical protein